MGFANWESNVNANATTSLNVTTPIVSNGSLLISSTNPAVSENISGLMHLNSNFARGLEKGVFRTLARYSYVKAAFQHSASALFALATVDINTGAAGTNTYYLAGTAYSTSDPNAPDATHFITKVVAGTNPQNLILGGAEEIANNQVLTGGLVQDDILPMEFRWEVDIANLGGTRLTYSVGNVNDLDYSNLVTVYDLVDSASPITSGDREGVIWFNRQSGTVIAAGTGSDFDQTFRAQLV